jgi:hypothetical protein
VRIAFDENMPPVVVRALRPLVESETAGTADPIEVLHAVDLGGRGTDDGPLIRRLAEGASGKAALVTADRKMRTRRHEREEFRRTGVIGIVLASNWNNQTMWVRAQLVLAWWPEWIMTISTSRPGVMWDCPFAMKPRRMRPSD